MPTPLAASSVPVAPAVDIANGVLLGTKPMVRVAVVGDQGLGPRPIAALDLIRDAAADFLVVVGDFDYDDKPQAWADQLNRLGADFLGLPWWAITMSSNGQSTSA